MEVARIGLRLIGITTILLSFALPASILTRPAQAQLTISETRCRRALHSGAQRLYRTTLAKQATCHRQRMLGKFSALRDCTDPDRLPNSLILGVIEDHLLRRARNACEGTPAGLGYETCDAPCENVPIVSFTDVGRCLVCQAKAEAETTTENLYGNPPVPGRNTDGVRCQTAIGEENIRYATSLLTSHRRCQFLQDRGAIPASIDCRREDFFRIFTRAREVLARRIERLCDLEQVNLLDGCTDTSNTLDCILRQARQSTDLLYRQVYQKDQEAGGKFVFVTSQAYFGFDIGGLAGADAICQAAADSSEYGLDGTFLAWLSDGDESPATRFTKSVGPYVMPDGTEIAPDFTALAESHPAAAIDVDENGNKVIFQRPVWTGTLMTGEAHQPGLTCGEWGVLDSLGIVGIPYFIGGGLWSDAGALRCNQEAHLYCFEQ